MKRSRGPSRKRAVRPRRPAPSGGRFAKLAALALAASCAAAFSQGVPAGLPDPPPAADPDAELCPGGVCPVPDFVSFAVPGGQSAPDGGALSLLADAGEPLRTLAGDPGADAFFAFVRGDPPRGENGFAKALGRGGAPLLALALLVAGLLLNLSPCTLPLVPVNLAILGIGAGRSTKARGAAVGAAFGGGMAASYGALGLLAARGGRTFGAINGSVAFAVAAGLAFALMALAAAGVVTVDFSRLRAFLPRRRAKAGASPGGAAPLAARLAGAFGAGALSAALAGACVAPALVSALVLAADLSARGLRFAAFVPFLLGLGMALPWPLLGAGLASLPRPGKWMRGLQFAFAAVFAAAALLSFGRAAKIAAAGTPALSRLSGASRPGAVRVVDTSRPAQMGLAGTAGRGGAGAALEGWTDDEDAAIRAAAETGRPLLVFFTADWCAVCARAKRTTLADAGTRAAIAAPGGPVALVVDCTAASSPRVQALLARFKVPGLPFFAVFRPRPPKKTLDISGRFG